MASLSPNITKADIQAVNSKIKGVQRIACFYVLVAYTALAVLILHRPLVDILDKVLP